MKTPSICLTFLLLATAAGRAQTPAPDDSPETRLFDTGAGLPDSLNSQVLTAKRGWSLVPEDTTAHTFTGSAVVLNDKLVIAFTQGRMGPIIYSRSTGKALATVDLRPISALAQARMMGWKVLENSASGVKIEGAYGADRALRVRLTTGESIVEVQSNQRLGAVEVRSDTRFTIVSDYFGDDMIYPDGSYQGPLPAENFCLNLLGDGDAILMSVWQSNQQQGSLEHSDVPFGQSRTVNQISCVEGKNIWLAFMEQPGIWHARPSLELDSWRAPFPAKWRTSYLRAGSQADSWDTEQGPDAGQKAGAHTGPVLTYPADRSVATPLTATCPTDVMRNTLGVGPCQYILACEGMAAQGDPTPNSVMGWVEKQFEQKKQRKAADDIKERLGQMVRHVGEARERIERYAAFGQNVRKVLGAPNQAPDLDPVLDDLALFASAGLTPEATAERAQQLAGKVIGLVNQPDSLKACREIGEELRAIGAVQDRALARCRMAVRRVRLQARAGAPPDVQRLCEQLLNTR